MMPSLDHCISNTSEMSTLTKTLEVFDTYKQRDDKDSDEESFHLPLDDDELDTKVPDPVQNGNGNESEEEILNKFDSTPATLDPIDSQLEDRLLNDDDEEKKGNKEDKEETCSTSADNLESNKAEVVENGHVNVENGDNSSSEDHEKDESVSTKDQTEPVNSIASESEELSQSADLKNEEVSTKKDDEVIKSSDKVNDNESGISDAMEVDNVPKLDVEENLPCDEKEGNAIDPLCDTENEQTKVDKPVDSCIDKTSNEEVPADVINAVQDVEMEESSVTEEQTNEKLSSNKLESDDNARQTHEEESDDPQSVEKCENSNDSTKQNEDSEDLFDISVIRDAEEDNAESAYNEAHPEENEEDVDDKMEDESTIIEKTHIEEEEDEEIDIDKSEDPLKSDDVDIEETNINLECDGIKDIVSDGEGENSNKTDLVQVNTEQKSSNDKNNVEKSEAECRLDEVTGSLVASDGKEIHFEEHLSDVEASENKDNEDSSTRTTLKRPLSGETETGMTKKSRTETVADVEIKELEKLKEKLPLKQLLSLSDFMKSRKHTKRLTMHDLEEFCVQKICEVIVHKSELGDVHHQLKLQEQLIETMRKEIQQLTKQARDLEIVNKKLLNDLKQQTATQKPLNPLKITRSVGLQVKFTPSIEANFKRRQSSVAASNQKGQAQSQTTPTRGNRVLQNAAVATVNRQVSSPQKHHQQQQQQQLPKPSTPLLSQALQSRRNVVSDAANKIPNHAVRPKPADPKPSASVIDLTDEDDKKDKNKNSPAKMVPSKNIAVPLRTTPMRVNATAQGIRLTTSQGGKVTPVTSLVNSSTPGVMYVVQSSSGQNVLGSKAVVVNFQSANGVLTSALNGSAVSVIPKQSNTIQLKTVATSPKSMQNNKAIKMQNKHPAPLPPPPIVRLSLDKPLKAIPPKPHLTIKKTDTGIILQWKMPYELEMYEVIASYQLYAYQETSASPSTDMWRKVGDVKALALPMACTLTQFADKNKYYFAVRAVDIHKRIGMFSEPEEISL